MVRGSSVVAAVLCAMLSGACGHEPAVCGENLSIDISNGVLGVYTGALNSGTGSGSGSFSCVQGGSGTYSGTWSPAGYDLMLEFMACKLMGTQSTLTLTGTFHDTNNLQTHVETGEGDMLMLGGNETSCNQDPIDATCKVMFSFTGRDSSGVPTGSGSVCGIAFP